MLIWKTNSFDIKIASVRYRCLLPSRYLELNGYKSCFYAGNNPINFKDKSDSDVLIFVKSFTPYDLSLAKKAKEAGVPVILDICDNIFIDEYVSKCQFKHSEVFKQMSEVASAIVTTGVALKDTIETQVNSSVPIFIIPDANEAVEDIKYALYIGKLGRWLRLFSYKPVSTVDIIRNSLLVKLKFIQKYYKKNRKAISNRIKDNYRKLQIDLNKYKKATKTFSKKLIKLAYFHKYLHYIKKTKNILLHNQNNRYVTSELATSTIPLQKPTINQVNLIGNVNESPLTVNNHAKDNCKTIIWFGNHGAAYGNFGMLNLLDIVEPLIKISKEINFRLLVVSNNYKKYCKYIQPLPFHTDYMEWDLFSIYENISQSDVVIIPNSQCAFSICKSANRAILSLSLGTPVVATKTPALEDLEECIIFDDWEKGLKAYLSDEQLVDSDMKKAKSIINSNYSGEAVANRWLNLIEQVTGG
ncbi:hypothetical protein NIES267_04600 [Calothrix parasitica NIES-267]|uniref:Uncharacterized protein n=1 Tax=Calothrix parasitica NIES-267 TaxID=1973488 RepID=A0A1Z4LID5_9CYAN|nr:hypothetical protein NIES267_04600 [Calothrix parasitica NIES-267]